MYLDVQSDYKRISKNTINHTRGAIVRTLLLIPAFGCLYFPLSNLALWYIIIKAAIVGLMMAFWWWEFFDGWLNTKRGKSWRYNGSDDPNDAKTDNFLQNYTPKQQMLIKWGLIIIFTIFYILFK